ncbi:elongation factor 4 [Candidatus Uhrbacteria bacterium]|nr:elongation factor 4 [Candidatus Uhrbacteria bacterium]
MDRTRNFCIIAHIDHGKSTLSDRLIEVTGTVSKRDMQPQLLDQMDIERERGITIKLQPVRMHYKSKDGQEYLLNLIDTPGHVDFTYEVSRSLAAVEGAILLVDATQGVQAQTIGNLYLALEQNLTIIPVVNKIDMPSAEPEKAREELVRLLGCAPEDVLFASGKTGQGVPEILEEVIKRVPPPKGDPSKPLRALVFDSSYDDYKGVVAFVRVIDGSIKRADKMHLAATSTTSETLEVGYFTPKYATAESITAGEIGYVVTGLKDISACRVGDTVTVPDYKARNVVPLEGYKTVNPMVFAGLFPAEGDEFDKLREAMLRLKLNDAALQFEPEHSPALGFGFRCGLLGLLHLEIVQERLKREYNLEVIVTVPSVAYRVTKTSGEVIVVKSPADLPDPSSIRQIEDPWMKVDIVSPRDHLGAIMAFVQEKRGLYKDTEYLGNDETGRVILHYEVPLSSLLVDFYDNLKNASSGYASLNYEFLEYRKADVVKLDILVAEDQVEALASIVYADSAQRVGRRIVEKLKETLPRQQFEVKIQAAVGGKIVASERITAYRKDVTGYLYGGDVTRKRKLLEKQKKGKKRMMKSGRIDIPPEAYMAVLKK